MISEMIIRDGFGMSKPRPLSPDSDYKRTCGGPMPEGDVAHPSRCEEDLFEITTELEIRTPTRT
jgi:hypothetical protein